MKSLSLFFLSFLMLTSLASAGERGGNGGGGIFCEDGNHEIYDLQEGRLRYKLQIVELPQTTIETIELGFNRLKENYPVFAQLVLDEIDHVLKKIDFLNVKIERTLDSDNLYVNEGCEYHQIANWDTSIDRIIVSKARWEAQSAAQKGVLLFHEAVYSLYRSPIYGLQHLGEDQLVDPVGKFVAEVFSTGPITTRLVKTPFIRGGLYETKSKDQGSRFVPNTPVMDQHIVLNPFCMSDDFRLNFGGNFHDNYHLIPQFGDQPGKLQKVKYSSNLVFNVKGLPIKYTIHDYTDIERISSGVPNPYYTPKTVAGVKVVLQRLSCGEEIRFDAPCVIQNTRGTFKRVECRETTIDLWDLKRR